MTSTNKDKNENIIHIPFDMPIDFNKGLGEYFFEAFKKNGNLIAQIDSSTGKKETYNELFDRCVKLAQALQINGINSDGIVSYCCYNNMDYAATFAATMFLGARVNPIDITRSKEEILHCLKLSRPHIIFCDNEIEDVMEAIISELNLNCKIVVFNGSKKHTSLTEFMEKYKSEEEFHINKNVTGRDTACISYTSGTSGLSKAAQLTNFGLYYGGISGYRNVQGLTTTMIFTLPYWISNISVTMTAFLHGQTRVIYKTFNKDTLCPVLEKYKVNSTLLSQAMISELIQNKDCCNYDTSELKCIYYAGSNMGSNLILEISKLFPNATLLNGFGMTEIAGILFIPHKKELDLSSQACAFTVGKPNPGFHYKVVDTTTEKALGPNERGELRVKYAGVMNGYLNNPEATKEAFDEDGFFRTGDIVYYDNDYYFFVVDRLKEIFKYKGNHVSPLVIESELLSHSAVKEAVAIGFPNLEVGELPMGVVVLKEGAEAKEEEIVNFVNARIPSDIHHIRAGIKFVKSLPKTGTGKYKRNYIRDLIVQGKI